MKRIRSELGSTKDELREFFELKMKKSKQKRRSKPDNVAFKRKIPMHFKKQLIQLYYGSTNDFSKPVLRISQLARIFILPD